MDSENILKGRIAESLINDLIKNMLIKSVEKFLFAILGLLLLLVSPAFADKWSQHYIESLPDSAFAAIEITRDGKKVRHLPHHNHIGEVDVYHLKKALAGISEIKWIDSTNLAKAKAHLEQHYQAYKQKKAEDRGLKGPVNINKASSKELIKLPHIGEKRAKNIIEYRKMHGDFKNVGELRRVPGIGPKIFKDIEDFVTVK